MIRSVEAGNKALESLIEQVYHQTSTLKGALMDGNGPKETRKIGKLRVMREERIRRSEERRVEHKYDRFYEQLYDGEHQKEDLENLKKLMVSTNLDKNLESYFVEKKLRVPEFIKRLR